MPKPLTFVQADIMLAKSHHLPFLDELKEIMDNELHLVVLGAAIRDKTASDISCESPALAKILVGCKRIVPDRSQKFDIVFENYIMYQVRNESYSSIDPSSESAGTYLRIFDKSPFLNYLSFATDVCQLKDGSFYPGPWKQYGIFTQNHIVDVISTEEPKVFYTCDTK